jgi:hypothetical protein
VAKWAASTSYAPGSLVRQLTTPAVGSERVFLGICTTTSTSGTTEPTWVITKGGVVVDNTNITWQEVTGQPAMNGDTVNTPTWAVLKAAGTAPTLGFIIQDNAGVNLFICSTAGAIGATQPTFVTSSFGATTTDSSAHWKYIGAVTAYADWAAPHARITNALTTNWGASGDTHCVSSDHAETQTTTITLNAGITTNSVLINCISPSVTPPTTTTTGASVSLPATANMNVGTSSGATMFINGITFNLGTGSGASSFVTCSGINSVAIFENCTFNLVTTATTSSFIIGSTCSSATFRGCFFTAANASQGIAPAGGYIDFIGCDLFKASGTAPTSIMLPITQLSVINIRGCALSTTTTIVASVNFSADITIENCSNSSGGYTGGGSSSGGPRVRYANAANVAVTESSGFANYGLTCYSSANGFRTGGGADASWGNTGRTSLFFNNTTTLPKLIPVESPPITVWCSTTGVARTLTVYLSSFSTLTNAVVWITVEYLDSGTTNHAAELSTRANPVAAPTALTTDTSTWTNGSNFPYSISATVTPQQIGPIKVRIYCVNTAFFFVDPLVVMV